MINRIIAKIKKTFNLEYIMYKGVLLPPGDMRLMGEEFRNDQNYLDSVLREGERFASKLGLNKDSVMLEIGCSSGRSVIGLIEKVGSIKKYVGLDISMNNVNWCNQYIAGRFDFCEFRYIDLWHILYNTRGKIKVDDNFKLNFDGGYFDLVYLHSVLTNTIDNEIPHFAREYFRLLKPGGTLFLTAFIEEGVPDVTENPENYVRECKFPQQVMRYEKNFFLGMFTKAGFEVERYEQGTEVDYQSAVYFRKPK